MEEYEIKNIKEQIAIFEIDINDETIPVEIREEMKNELNALKEKMRA